MLELSAAISYTISVRFQPKTILRSHRKSIISIMASPIQTISSTAPQKGFLSLPREIRDEVYRLVVRGDYIAAGQPPLGQSKSKSKSKSKPKDCRTTATTSLKLAILRVSKSINQEATDIFYQESTFHFNMYHGSAEGSDTTVLFASRDAIYRMMNIDIDIEMDDLEFYLDSTRLDTLFALHEERRQIWITLMRSITRGETRRKTVCVRCRSCSSDITTKMPKWCYAGLGRLSQFRTVAVVLSPPLIDELSDQGTSHGTEQSAEHLETLETSMKLIKDCLRLTLGPAVAGHKHNPGHLQYASTLEFHPQEHLSRILSAEATSLKLAQMALN